MPEARRPLLVIDGDNFAHRSYHALPKSIRRTGNRGAGAIVGLLASAVVVEIRR
jgi:DNA polymerase-1